MASHPGIDKIAFTGSTQTGRAITIAAAQSNLKKVTLELGGKSANISELAVIAARSRFFDSTCSTRCSPCLILAAVFPSADLEQAVNWAALGVFENAGQSCSAGSRVLVHESIKDEFERRIVEAAEKIEVSICSRRA